MNLQDNKLLIFSCFISLLTISGCGLKGDLYQTPASVKGEGFIPEDQEKPQKKALQEASEQDNKPTKKEETVVEQELK